MRTLALILLATLGGGGLDGVIEGTERPGDVAWENAHPGADGVVELGPAPVFELTGTSGTALPVVGLTYDARDATASSWASKSGSITVSEQGAGTPTTGEPTPVNGAEAVGFSSTTYYQSTADYTAPGTDPIHITALVKSPSTFGSDKRIIQARGATGSYPFDFLFNSTGDVQVFRLGDNATLRNVATSPVPAGAWMLIEAFLDPAGNGTIYVNGAQEGQSNISATGTTTQDNPITIGAFQSGVSTSDIQIAFVSVESGSSVLGTDSENLAAHQDRFYRLIGAAASDGTEPTTATRSSAGYLTKANSSGDNQLFLVGENWPRVGSYNDGTTTRNAVQIEGAATNLLTHSEDFSNAAWTNVRSSDAVSAVAAPDPSKFGTSLIADVSNNTHYIAQSITVTATTQYAFSAYLRAGDRSVIAIDITDNKAATNAVYNLATGAVVSTGGGADAADVESIGDGWYRCILVFESDGDADGGVRVWTSDFTAHAGDGSTPSLYMWGAQLETGPYATSYIPTTSASATRAPDALRYTGLSIQGPLTLDVYAHASVAADGDEYIATLTPGTAFDERVILWRRSAGGGQPRSTIRSGGSEVADIVGLSAFPLNAWTRVTVTSEADSHKLFEDGTLQSTDASGAAPGTMTQLAVSGNRLSQAPFRGYIGLPLRIYDKVVTP